MNNFTEDLTGLSRADLVYKAKLAEQAERCAFRSPACPYHFRQKLQKASSRRLCWGAIGARGSGSRGAPDPSPGRPTRSYAMMTPRMTRTRRFWGISPIASRTAGRDPGPDLARGIVFRPLSGSLGVPRWSSGRPWRAHAGATPRAGGAGAVIRRGSGLPGAVKGARARPGATARRPAPDRARVPPPAPSTSPPDLAVP